MSTEMIFRPRLLFTKIMKRYCRSHYSPKLAILMRNKLRKLCVNDELKVHVKPNFWMNVSPKDYATYGIYFFGTYDPHMTSVFSHLVKPGETVWDIGTERGWFTLHLAKLVGNTGRVDSFEAFPPTFEKLMTNVALNNLAWVKANCAAVSDKSSKMWFVPPSNDVTNNVSYLNECNGVGYLTDLFQNGAIEVDTISLDEYYSVQGIEKVSLLKMDIEGAEVRALNGAKNLIKKDKPILAIEFNRQTALRASSSVEELNDLIKSFGYKMYLFEGKFIPFVLENHSGDIVLNVYCFPV
jgi:FkbM family methyltransferase